MLEFPDPMVTRYRRKTSAIFSRIFGMLTRIWRKRSQWRVRRRNRWRASRGVTSEGIFGVRMRGECGNRSSKKCSDLPSI